MSIFVVVQQNATGPAGTLASKITETRLPSYPLSVGVWLIAYRGTAQDLCGVLGIQPDATHGTAVVTEVSSYYGRANPAIWTWIKTNWEGQPLG